MKKGNNFKRFLRAWTLLKCYLKMFLRGNFKLINFKELCLSQSKERVYEDAYRPDCLNKAHCNDSPKNGGGGGGGRIPQ